MRFDNQGITLWYGTDDAPAPDGIVGVPPGETLTDLSITVGVTPPDPSNTVQVRYRVNGGTPSTVLAAFLRADGARQAQYFRAWLPQLRGADRVEYTATCHCVGRQVPAPELAAGYLSSFTISAAAAPPGSAPAPVTGPPEQPPGGAGRVSGAAQASPELPAATPAASPGPAASQLSALAQPEVFYAPTSRAAGDPLVAERLNQRLGGEVRRVMGRMSPALQQAVQAAQSPAQWSSAPGQRIADTAVALLAEAGQDPDLAAEVSQVHARVAATATPTVAGALCLDTPLRDNPALHEIATNGMIAELARLAGLGDQAIEAVLQRSAALASGGAVLDELIAQGTLSHSDASALGANLELARLTDDNLALVRALRAAGAAEPASLAGWTREHWQQLISGQHIPVPPGDTPNSYADAIVHNLETTYPAYTLAAHADDNRLADLLARNPNLDLRHLNLAEGQAAHLDWTGIPAAARPAVEHELRSSQRLIALADETEARLTLKRTGHDSAIAIAAKTEAEFIRASGLGEGQARLTYARAQETALSVASSYGAMRDVLKDAFTSVAVENVSPLVNDLRQIDGLSDLFGPQDFCDCDDCHSVLSPAAYFTDLMHFVESNVSRPVFLQSNQPQHPLYLKRRRPDLWSLRLTCENTHTLIPYLTIVNEVLEAYLGDVAGGDIYQQLSDPSDTVSFQVPFSLPFAELSLYLDHFGLAPADIYRTLGHPDAKVWRAQLGLAPDEATVIAKPDPEHVVSRLGSPASLADCDLQGFLRATGLQRDELDSVLASRFSRDLAAITVTSRADPGELQNFAEIIQNLTAARLDFLHRYVRLWRTTHWQIPELDLVLLAARDSGAIGHDVDDTAVQLLGRLSATQAALRLSAEELCALAGQLPVSAAFPRQPSMEDRRLYERLFDLVTLFGPLDNSAGPQVPGRELAQSFTYHHYSLDTLNPADTTIDPRTPLLLGSLGISETDLLQLLALLKDQMPFDTAGNCTLDRRRLSLLYRHVRIARALNLRIDDFTQALQLLFEPSQLVLTTLSQIEQLTAFTSWLRTSPFSVAELRFILTGAGTGPAGYTNPDAAVAQLVQQVQASPAASPLETLRSRLAAIFNVTGAWLADTLAFTASDLTSTAIQTALAATFTNGVPDTPGDLAALAGLVHQLERAAALFVKLKLDDDAVSYLRRHPGSLGITNIKTLTWRDVQSIGFYRALAATRDNTAGLVQTVLDDYLSAGSLPGDSRARLADLWQADQSLLDSLCAVMTLPASPIDALSRLRDGLNTCLTLGINGYSLQKLGDDASFGALTEARDIAVGAFSAKYPDETTRAQTLQPYEDQINTVKRDALCDYIAARQAELKFRDRNEIYDFFLLDVDTGGCFRSSRVVSAISSVQLYVQRCMLNLEQTDPRLNPAIPAAHVDPTCIPADEWEWRENYRVWEANRKVFLYPESYTDPDLLDIKTPLLADLEDDLLQQKITSESASEAYQGYLTQFAELAHLRIAGTYYRAETHTYYFFGRTQQDPAVYYWRTWDGATWSPWQKIDLAIDAPAVAAEFHLGRLYLFWVDGKSKDKTSIKNGSSQLEYYEVAISLLYSTLNSNGKWLAPQKLDSLYPPWFETTVGSWTFTADSWVFTPPGTVVAGNRILADDALRDMELSRSYRNVYPRAVQDSLVLSYYNNYLSGPAYSDRQLDLFHNKLRASDQVVPGLPPSPAVRLYPIGEMAQLGIATSLESTEAGFDIALEQPLAAEPLFYITAPFPFSPFTQDQACRNYLVNLVHNRYPESVLTVGDQDYLIHETPPVPAFVGPFLPPRPGSGGTVFLPPSISAGGTIQRVHPPTPVIAGRAIQPFHLATPVTAVPPSHPASAGATVPQAHPAGSQIRSALPAGPLADAHAQVTRLASTPSADGALAGVPLPLGGTYSPIVRDHRARRREMVRLSTSRADDLGQILMEDGLECLFAPETQQQLREKPVGFTITDPSQLQYPADDPGHLSFKGAFGSYYREIYLHIPWLIARHLRAEGRFEDAIWWYRRVFDPTASESPHDQRPTDRNWRYIEFRDWTVPKLKELLTDAAAINAYKQDPFNPHAIARLRPSAYQKAIVMDTIGTLIDWGDALFAQDTMESVTEAGMLYNLASEILGRKPARLGKCHTVNDEDLTYEKLGPAIDKGSEFLLLLENWTLATQAGAASANPQATFPQSASGDGTAIPARGAPAPLTADHLAPSAPQTPPGRSAAAPPPQFRPSVQPYATAAAMLRQTNATAANLAGPAISPRAQRPPAIPIAIQSTLVFCVPPNQVLLSCWDRVQDRQFKIRNCMNISGVRRQLALFQPPIEPMDLVRARAAGLSLDEALAALEAPVPPYRFAYLIDRARQAAQTVQSFGAALLSALEKKDVEELTLLRSLHERAVLRATKDVKTQQVQEAEYQLQALAETETNVQNRIDYYNSLISGGLTFWEITEQISRVAATVSRAYETYFHLGAAITHLVPQAGSPFAMTYGGNQLGDSLTALAALTGSLAGVLDGIAGSVSLEATFQRRDQEWHEQLLLAQQELKQVEQQRLAADIRTTITARELDIHQTTMDQADELDEFYKDKFTGLGLYNYLATTLTRLHHEAYNVADELARMAQRAYQFERDDDTVFVAPGNWQADKAGLLAGERLTLQLQQLENAYLARNTRQFEITQSFSLTLTDPGALLNLRETGSCEFTLPEILFDLAYPGQYKRILSGVRLTLPCVTGPYTNVSAKLTLQESKVRKTPTPDPSALVTLPVQTTPSIAASTGNNDSGQFEFSFRDERYLPFEGAGAISTWRLDLPSRLRLFDYATIPDVILHLSYRALDDGAFRDTVEADLVDTLTTYASTAGMHRLFSLRHDFPDAFYKLLHPAGTAQETTFDLGPQHFPYFLSGQTLTNSGASIFIQPDAADPYDTTGLTIAINGTSTQTWTTPTRTSLRTAEVPLSGPALAPWAIKVTAGQLDPAKIGDLFMLLKYNVT